MCDQLKTPWDFRRLKMLLLGTRSACNAAMNEDQENLGR